MKQVALIGLLLLLGACASQVGDSCTTSVDCGPELQCDSSQPGGYCTASPCEVNACPDESVCIEFPDESRFCMRRCDGGGDCRDDYVCVDNYGDAPFCNAAPYLGP